MPTPFSTTRRRPVTEEATSGFFRTFNAVALSLITAGQRGADVSDTSHRVYRQLAPERR